MAAQESAELRGRRSNAETAGLIGFFDALISTDTDPAVDLVVHTSTGTNGRIGMSEHAVVARSSTAAHSSSTARQGLTGYEQRAGARREFSA